MASLFQRPVRALSHSLLAGIYLMGGVLLCPFPASASTEQTTTDPSVIADEWVDATTQQIPEEPGNPKPELEVPPIVPLEQQVDPKQLMRMMRQSFSELNYEVSYIHVDSGHIEPIRYTHAVVDGVEIAHLTHLTEPVREMVLRGDNVTHFEPNMEPFTVPGHYLPGVYFQLFNSDLDRLEKSYQILVAGRSRMAGRPAQVVRMVPRDEHRYGFVLWLDMDTQMLLRADMISREGEMIQQVMAVSLYFSSQPSPWMSELSQITLPPVIDIPKFDPSRSPLRWGAGWLPKGFVLENADRHRLAMIDRSVDYLQFSDGLIKISVYVSKASDTPSSIAEQRIRQGALSLHSLIRDNIEITVVGEVPPATTQRIAESVFPVLAKGPLNAPEIDSSEPAQEQSQ